MEGVGARLGRSSARYGPTTVFTGPVRKWKKKWTHITPSTSSGNNHNHHLNNNTSTTNGGSNGSHLLLFKWTPIPAKDNGNGNGNGEKKSSSGSDLKNGSRKEDDVSPDEPPKRKFKYIPVAVLEEQKLEASEQVEDETETDTNVEPTSKSDELDEKPDINDVPMEEGQDAESKQEERQDLNESLNLNLGLNSNDGDNNSQSETDQTKDDQPKQL